MLSVCRVLPTDGVYQRLVSGAWHSLRVASNLCLRCRFCRGVCGRV